VALTSPSSVEAPVDGVVGVAVAATVGDGVGVGGSVYFSIDPLNVA
jgi:hypothetical protein